MTLSASSNERVKGMVDGTTALISLFSRDGEFIHANPAATGFFGDARPRLLDWLVDRDARQRLLECLDREDEVRSLCEVTTTNGRRWHDLDLRSCTDTESGRDAVLLTCIDVTELKAAGERAHFLAQNDRLTGLRNRDFLELHVSQLVEQDGPDGRFVLLLADIDDFQGINNWLGDDIGNRILEATANRIRASLRGGDVAARVSGDQFAIVSRGTDDAESCEVLVTRLRAAIAAPLRINGHDITIPVSFGIAMYPCDGSDFGGLMRNAHLALQAAKAQGWSSWCYFRPSMNEKARRRVEFEAELRAAIRERQFVVHYQPRVSIADNRADAVEALVRWNHPARGILLPGHFIGMCEETGLIHDLGMQVLEEALRQQLVWKKAGLDLGMSINLSPRQLERESFADEIGSRIRAIGADPATIEFEITESMLLVDDGPTSSNLATLTATGFNLSIDDFGTGYSNLAHILRFPVSCIKIDRSFIIAGREGPAIVDLILTLARQIGARVVAEGVETDDQLNWLRECGCPEYQGFLFSRPIPADMLEKRIAGFPQVAAL
ncbi:MAG: EAL domain-containing protein [Geminicoccaceae bacterium]